MKAAIVYTQIRNKSDSVRHIYTGVGLKHINPGEILTCGTAYAESLVHGMPDVWERISDHEKSTDAPVKPATDTAPAEPAVPSKPVKHRKTKEDK